MTMLLKFLCILLAASLGTGFQLAELKCWTQRNNSFYLGLGLQISENIDDTVECIKKCRELDYCHAVDINTNSRPKCWYQQSNLFTALMTDVLPKAGCTNYLYSPECGQIIEGVDLNCWTVSPKSRIWGLAQFDRRTLGECLEACTSRIDCYTVDWNTLTKPNCWIQTSPMDVSPSKLWLTLFGTNFMLNRECLNLLATVESADLPYWKVSEMATYGTEWLTKVDAFNLRSCLDFCKSNQYCYMVDFDPASKSPCYAQTNPFVIKRGNLVWSKTGYNFLFLREEYEKKYPAHSVVQESYCWFYLNDTNYSGKGLQSVSKAGRNLDSCLTPCHSNPLCKAATYDSNSITPCAHVISKGELNNDNYLKQKDVTLYVPDIGCTQDKDKK